MKSPSENTDQEQDLFDMGYKRTICVDFDGVIHWYREGWNKGEIYDEPVPGAIDWLREMVLDERFEIAIYSSRSKDEGGVAAMQDWLMSKGLGYDALNCILFPTQKPAAWLTVDDRCFEFRGKFPTADYLLGFTPWMKVPEADQALNDIAFLRALADEYGGPNASPLVNKRLNAIADRLEGISSNVC